MRRILTTSVAAILVPFTTQELMQRRGSHVGWNVVSGAPIVADRTANMNANGFILGSSGAGKGVAAKHDMMNILLRRPDDDVIVIDPEREYEALVGAFGGTVVRIDAQSPAHINPMDLDLEHTVEDDPIIAKAESILAMLNTLIGGREGLSDVQRGIIDRECINALRSYAAAVSHGADATPPTLATVFEGLQAIDADDARQLAKSLEIYISGSLGTFAHQTNVDLDQRLISFDIHNLGPELKTFGMMVILDQIWQKVKANKAQGRRTWLYIDEFHLLFSNKFSADYFRSFYKRARKYGGSPIGITQDIEELLEHEDARLMLANSDYLYLLNQTSTNGQKLCELLQLTDAQRRNFTDVLPGMGVLKSGTAVIPVNGRLPEDNALFKLYDTKFD